MPAVRLAVCDIAEVLVQYNRSKDLKEEFSSRQQVIRAEDEKRTKTAQDLARELEQLNPASEQFQKRFADLEKQQLELKNWRDWQDSSLRRWHLRMMRELYQEVVAAVAETAKERGVQVVFYQERLDLAADDIGQMLNQIARRQVIYSAPDTDMTPLVLKKLQDAYKAKNP